MSTEIGYFTDVEGNFDYFQKYLSLSGVLQQDKDGSLLLKEGAIFVFGGDVCDKGIGSIRITRLLVALKKKYGDRVRFIMGNRDINKMRWTSELDDFEIQHLDDVPGPYWVKEEIRVSPRQFLSKVIDAQGTAPTPESKAAALLKLNTPANRVRWMLEATMGSAGDFERRKQELSIITGKQEISDEEVVESFLSSVRPGGEQYEFLKLGQLAYIHEETLFVHGGINKENMGYVPFASHRFASIKDWVNALNAWYKEQFDEWDAHRTWAHSPKASLPLLREFLSTPYRVDYQGRPSKEEYDDRTKWQGRGAHRLLDYVVPGTVGSVIYTHMFNKHNNCQLVDPAVGKKLNEFGIKRLVVGHQPHGHSPAVMKDEFLEVIDADTSYSDMTAKDNRGKAASSVVIKGKDVSVNGILPNEDKIDYTISLTEGHGDQFIGKRVYYGEEKHDNSFWVKAKLQEPKDDGKNYVICKVNGFVVEYGLMSTMELKRMYPPRGETLKYSREFLEDLKEVKVHDKVIPIEKLATVITPVREIVRVPFFKEWARKVVAEFNLRKIVIQSVDKVGPNVRFIKLQAQIENSSGQVVPGIVFLRGQSVAVLLVLTDVSDPKKTKWVVVIRHPRAAIGEYYHLEIPVGFEDGTPLGVIRNLMDTEIGLEFQSEKVVNMNEVLYGYDRPIYVSPGASDEGIRFYLIECAVTSSQIRMLKSGSNTKKQLLAPELIPLEELATQCPDSKSILAAHLYETYLRKVVQQKGKTWWFY